MKWITMIKYTLAAFIAVASLSAAAHAAVAYRWGSSFDMGVDTAYVQSRDGGSIFRIICGQTAEGNQFGIEVTPYAGNSVLSHQNLDVQVVVDGQAYTATLTGNATTFDAQRQMANMVYGLIHTKETTFTIEIPAINWSEKFSTLGSKGVLALSIPGRPNASMIDDCMN